MVAEQQDLRQFKPKRNMAANFDEEEVVIFDREQQQGQQVEAILPPLLDEVQNVFSCLGYNPVLHGCVTNFNTEHDRLLLVWRGIFLGGFYYAEIINRVDYQGGTRYSVALAIPVCGPRLKFVKMWNHVTCHWAVAPTRHDRNMFYHGNCTLVTVQDVSPEAIFCTFRCKKGEFSFLITLRDLNQEMGTVYNAGSEERPGMLTINNFPVNLLEDWN